jgi:hypothetical protein
MTVGVQLHTPDTLPLGKNAPVTMGKEKGSRASLDMVMARKLSAHFANWILVCQVHDLVTIQIQPCPALLY